MGTGKKKGSNKNVVVRYYNTTTSRGKNEIRTEGRKIMSVPMGTFVNRRCYVSSRRQRSPDVKVHAKRNEINKIIVSRNLKTYFFDNRGSIQWTFSIGINGQTQWWSCFKFRKTLVAESTMACRNPMRLRLFQF